MVGVRAEAFNVGNGPGSAGRENTTGFRVKIFNVVRGSSVGGRGEVRSKISREALTRVVSLWKSESSPFTVVVRLCRVFSKEHG